MAKRGENIYKRKDGRYEGRYIKGRKIDGKPIFGYIYAYSYAQVKSSLQMVKASLGNRTSLKIIGKGSFGEFMNYWLCSVIKPKVKPSTFAQYYDRVHKHVIPSLGGIAVCKMSKTDVQEFINRLEQKNLAASTIRNIAGTLFSAIKKARELSLLEEDPCLDIKLPENTNKKSAVLSRKEQLELEKKALASEDSVQLAVFLALYSGLRIGEICALKWKEIDLKQGTVTVERTLQRVRNVEGGDVKTLLIEGSPKSHKSRRTVPLPKGLTAYLKSFNKSTHLYVLSGTAVPVEPRRLRSQFKKLIAQTGLDIHFHCLRHTYATRCLENHFDIQTISELLGHSNAGVTMDIYAHSAMEHKRMLTGRVKVLSENYKPSNEPSAFRAIS